MSQQFQGPFEPLVLTFCGPSPNFKGNGQRALLKIFWPLKPVTIFMTYFKNRVSILNLTRKPKMNSHYRTNNHHRFFPGVPLPLPIQRKLKMLVSPPTHQKFREKTLHVQPWWKTHTHTSRHGVTEHPQLQSSNTLTGYLTENRRDKT